MLLIHTLELHCNRICRGSHKKPLHNKVVAIMRSPSKDKVNFLYVPVLAVPALVLWWSMLYYVSGVCEDLLFCCSSFFYQFSANNFVEMLLKYCWWIMQSKVFRHPQLHIKSGNFIDNQMWYKIHLICNDNFSLQRINETSTTGVF